MLTEELVVLDGESALWETARPLLEAALRLEHSDETCSWHGWRKAAIEAFLKSLPAHCTLLAGVWDVEQVEEEAAIGGKQIQERETLVLGIVCEVLDGTVCSIRTFDQLVDASLPPIDQLEPGYEHALALMRAAKIHIAPVALAIFTDKATWDEWILTGDEYGVDKAELFALLAHQGRCVVMGSQTAHHH